MLSIDATFMQAVSKMPALSKQNSVCSVPSCLTWVSICWSFHH